MLIYQWPQAMAQKPIRQETEIDTQNFFIHVKYVFSRKQ